MIKIKISLFSQPHLVHPCYAPVTFVMPVLEKTIASLETTSSSVGAGEHQESFGTLKSWSSLRLMRMQKRSCCQGEKTHCFLNGDKTSCCSGLWQADLDELLSFLTSGSYCSASEHTCLWWNGFQARKEILVEGICMARAQGCHRWWSLGIAMQRSVST